MGPKWGLIRPPQAVRRKPRHRSLEPAEPRLPERVFGPLRLRPLALAILRRQPAGQRLRPQLTDSRLRALLRPPVICGAVHPAADSFDRAAGIAGEASPLAS